MDKKKLVKIIVPICIVLAIAGIWVFKNIDMGKDTPIIPPSQSDVVDRGEANNDEDFLLAATSIDLAALTGYGLPLIIDFGSDSCIPCKEMAPALETINAEMQGLAIIKFVDVWQYPEAAEGFPIQVIPTQVLICADGTPYVPSDGMKDSGLEFTMYSYEDTGEHVFTVHQGGLTEEQMRTILADMGGGE